MIFQKVEERLCTQGNIPVRHNPKIHTIENIAVRKSLRLKMEFIEGHWGDLFSVAGFVFALIGLGYAGIQSKKARSSAEAAEEATIETRDSVGRHLLTIDLERSINLIQRLKSMHRDGHWEASLELYQALRAMLSAIISRYPSSDSELRERLSKSRASITMMERRVEARRNRGLGNDDAIELNEQLNEVQSNLEDMSNYDGLGD